MSLLQYGPLYLNLIEMRKYDRRAVYSGPNYLYHRHRLQARYVLNPGTQRNLFAGYPIIGNGKLTDNLVPVVPAVRDPAISRAQPGAGFPGSAGQVPAVSSDAAIRHMLLQPRQQLVYSLLGVPVLISPLPGFTTDVSGGPFPQGCDVEQIGARTYHVIFDVQTDVNETTQYLGSPKLPVVLAHTWSMEHVLDQKWFCARVIEGRITFRKDLLNALNQDPDDYRKLIVHPVPSYFVRESVKVRAEDDGCTLRYTIVDRQQPVGWWDNRIAKVEASHTYTDGVQALHEMLGDISITDWGKMAKAIPMTTHTIQAKAWVYPGVDRFVAENLAKQIITQRRDALQIAFIGRMFSGFSFVMKHNISDNSVEATYKWVMPSTGIANDLNLANQTSLVGPNNVFSLSSANTLGFGPPDDGVSRSTYLEKAVASALLQPLQSPTLPPNTPPTRAGGNFKTPQPPALLG